MIIIISLYLFIQLYIINNLFIIKTKIVKNLINNYKITNCFHYRFYIFVILYYSTK
jgi:hypothetical protein